jgi:hypothetical protein
MFSQLVTLYLTPVFYTFMESAQAWFGRGVVAQKSSSAAAESRPPVALPVEN